MSNRMSTVYHADRGEIYKAYAPSYIKKKLFKERLTKPTYVTILHVSV